MAATVWKGQLSFGLVSIPVTLVRAARAERVSLHQLYRAAGSPKGRGRGGVIEFPAGQPIRRETEPREPDEEAPVERVRQAAISPADERPIPNSEILKGYEYQPDSWVLIDRDEIKRITPQTSKVMEIHAFVRFSEVDPVYLESSYYVSPDRGGEKPYAVLYEALREAEFAAVAEVAMHSREHVLVVRPGQSGLIAHTIFFENEVHRQFEYRTDSGLVTKREVDLAKRLIESLAGRFEPGKYRDKYRERLEALIAAKVEGREIVAAQPAPPRTAVLDLVEALQKSIEAARKPPASAAPLETKPKKRAGRRTDRT